MHLVRRFFRSVFARAPTAEEEAWVASVLTPEELALWRRFPTYDRRHTLEVGREVAAVLGQRPDTDVWVAAALLHDIGKIEVGLGIGGRVVATLAQVALGRGRIRRWASRDGWRGRIGAYAGHGGLGAALIAGAGGRPEVARWAALHHALAPGEEDPVGIVPDHVVRALHAADHD